MPMYTGKHMCNVNQKKKNCSNSTKPLKTIFERKYADKNALK
jgi:hypothetical protein